MSEVFTQFDKVKDLPVTGLEIRDSSADAQNDIPAQCPGGSEKV
jgi:hypothetical protein